jgi:DNA-binding beta-propeller fold protein YncE
MRFFSMKSGQAHARLVPLRLVLAGTASVAVALVAACGSQYRPVVTPITPSGPAAQPPSYVVVVSAPSTTTPGIATVVDYAGDSVLALAPIGIGPETFTVDATGSTGYTLNSDGTLSNFPISSQLQYKQVTYTTLPSTAQLVNIHSPSTGIYAADLSGNAIDFFTSFPETFKLALPVAPTPISILGPPTVAQRLFAITQGAVTSPMQCNNAPTTGPTGIVNGIEVASTSVSSTLPVGVCPVFGVISTDGKRLFVLNRGDDTISVINAQNNTSDACTPFVNQSGQTVTCHPTLPLSTTAVTATGITPPNGTTGMGTVAGPVYAEYNAATAQLVVANYDGSTVSVIDVSEDEYGNDSATFGTTYTIPVGNNPASVTVLADGSRAYTANQTDQTVTILTLSGHNVEKTLPITGHPRSIMSTQNSLQGKVYVVSPDSPYLTILRTDLDIVDTTVLVEGNIVDARVTTQNGSSGNSLNVSRRPGYGEPCYLPGASASATLAQCQTLP